MRSDCSSCGLASPIFVNTELLSLRQLFMISKQEVPSNMMPCLNLLILAIFIFHNYIPKCETLKSESVTHWFTNLKGSKLRGFLPISLMYSLLCKNWEKSYPQVEALPKDLANNLSSIHVCVEVSKANLLLEQFSCMKCFHKVFYPSSDFICIELSFWTPEDQICFDPGHAKFFKVLHRQNFIHCFVLQVFCNIVSS